MSLIEKIRDSQINKSNYTGMGIDFMTKAINDNPDSINASPTIGDRIHNAISDVATGVATWGTSFRKPTSEELQQGRGSWSERAKLLAGATTQGLTNELIGGGMEKISSMYKGLKGLSRLEVSPSVVEKNIVSPSVIEKVNPPVVERNITGHSKENILKWFNPKDKETIMQMGSNEFGHTVTKPSGDIVPYADDFDVRNLENARTKITKNEWTDKFNSNLPRLNEIIKSNNRTGVGYKVEGLEGKTLKFSSDVDQNKKAVDILNGSVGDAFKNNKVGKQWTVNINPALGKSNVQDIASQRYFENLHGMRMTETGAGVFGDGITREGSGTYKSINQYMKENELGNVITGMSGQSYEGFHAWNKALLKDSGEGSAFGFLSSRSSITGAMKNVAIPVGAGYTTKKIIDNIKQKRSSDGI